MSDMNNFFSKILKPIDCVKKALDTLDYLGLLFVFLLCIGSVIYYLIKIAFK